MNINSHNNKPQIKKLDQEIEKLLIKYQIGHTIKLCNIILNNNAGLDASATGVGKTYTAIAVCKQLGLTPIIICPKSIIYNWKKVSKEFEIEPLLVVNYETIKAGKYYSDKDNRQKSQYIDIKIEKNLHIYKWNVPEKTIFIFDEVHKCSDYKTMNGQLLIGAKHTNKPMLILSATIADHPEKFKIFFYILNFIDPDQVIEQKLDYHKYIRIMDHWIYRNPKPMHRIHEMLFPERCSQITMMDVQGLFPETQITAVPYYIGKQREKMIEEQYMIISAELDLLREKGKKDKSNHLVKILRAHQKIELLKVPIFAELSSDFLENGFSVVIFVNFTQTLKTLADMLYVECLIYGEQTQEQRDESIKKFMENKAKIIICNIKSGATGLSLDDQHGGFPRASIISPSWSAIELLQALGRIHRAKTKSKSLQRIVYIANTVEEQISDKVRIKLNNVNAVNNGDLDLTNITFIKKR